MMVIINDVMAYMFGFFMGRTPLIQLSPKKTWEGFIGGGISTGKDALKVTVLEWILSLRIKKIIFMSSIFFILVFMSLGLAYIMCQYPYFVCPIEYSQELERMAMSCEPSALFRPQVGPMQCLRFSALI